MRIGIILSGADLGTDPGALRDYGQTVEGLGYDHLLAPEHVLGHDSEYHQVPLELSITHRVPFREPFTLFSYLAAVTERLQFITGILVLPQRQTAVVAKQAAEVDLLSRGRLILGVGVGWNSVEFEALGINFHSRGRRIEEQVQLLRALWADPLVTFKGEFERLDHVGINPLPERQIPIWMGGMAARVQDRIARMGDGWIVHQFASREALADLIAGFHERLRAAGRNPASVPIHIGIAVTGDNVARQAERLRWFADAGVSHVSLIARGATPGMASHLEVVNAFASAAGLHD